MHGARRVQRGQHPVLLGYHACAIIRTQRVFDAHLLLVLVLMNVVLIDGVAEGDDAACEAMWVVLCLELHLLLLVHLDGMQAILVDVWRFVGQLSCQLLLLQLLLLILVLLDRWKIEILVLTRQTIVMIPLFTIDHQLKLRKLFSPRCSRLFLDFFLITLK